jgi:hypothetical protein
MSNDAAHIDLLPGAFQKQAPGCMSEDIEVPVVHSVENPFGLLLLSQTKARMDGADRVIQLAQQVLGIVECPVGKDIDLR